MLQLYNVEIRTRRQVSGGQEASTEEHTVDDLGEFGLIDRISAVVGVSGAIAGIGDDTAVLDVGGAGYLLATVDMQVEGVHFSRTAATPLQIGRKAIAVNISDIAAMGGVPSYALVSLALSGKESTRFVDDLYAGMTAECRTHGAAIVGGNVTRTEGPVAIDVVLLGAVPRDEVVLRSGAQTGDALCVTGSLGNATAARLGRAAGIITSETALGQWIDDHMVPNPRVNAGRSLARSGLATAMIDISDGLSGDVGHLCAASGVGAELHGEYIPVTTEVERIAELLERDPLDLALSGGEDYELLLSVPENRILEARAACAPLPLHRIGTVTPQEAGIVLELAGVRRPLEREAWRHF